MPNRQIEWGDLEVFLAIARTGSLAGAATAIDVNASTVQRRIGRLEEVLEARLFERSPRGYALTTLGAELVSYATTMEEQCLAVTRLVRGAEDEGAGRNELTGRVRVETVDDLAVSLLAPILASFRAQHPRVHVDLRVRVDFANLGRGETDVAVRIGARPNEPELVARHAGRVGVALYASRDYVARNGAATSLEALCEHDVVCGDESMAEVPMEKLIARVVPPPTPGVP